MPFKPTAPVPARASQIDRATAAAHGDGRRAPRGKPKQPLTRPELLWRMHFPRGLPSGSGASHAKLVWLCLCSHLGWKAKHTDVWPSNERLARMTGLGIREVVRGLTFLEANGLITRVNGARPGYHVGRTITLHLKGTGENPRIRFPSQDQMLRIWHWCRVAREKPIALVIDIVGIMILAAAGDNAPVDQSTSLHVPLAAIRNLVGSSIGSTATERMVALESVGLINRVGQHWREGIMVHPPELVCGRRYSETAQQYPPIRRGPRTVPPQLRRFPRQPTSAGMTLADLDQQRASEASGRAWARPPGPWWDEQPAPW